MGVSVSSVRSYGDGRIDPCPSTVRPLVPPHVAPEIARLVADAPDAAPHDAAPRLPRDTMSLQAA
jgi:hypothetical protein